MRRHRARTLEKFSFTNDNNLLIAYNAAAAAAAPKPNLHRARAHPPQYHPLDPPTPRICSAKHFFFHILVQIFCFQNICSTLEICIKGGLHTRVFVFCGGGGGGALYRLHESAERMG